VAQTGRTCGRQCVGSRISLRHAPSRVKTGYQFGTNSAQKPERPPPRAAVCAFFLAFLIGMTGFEPATP